MGHEGQKRIQVSGSVAMPSQAQPPTQPDTSMGLRDSPVGPTNLSISQRDQIPFPKTFNQESPSPTGPNISTRARERRMIIALEVSGMFRTMPWLRGLLHLNNICIEHGTGTRSDTQMTLVTSCSGDSYHLHPPSCSVPGHHQHHSASPSLSSSS